MVMHIFGGFPLQVTRAARLLTLACMLPSTQALSQIVQVPSLMNKCAVFDCGAAAIVPETVTVTAAETAASAALLRIGTITGQPSSSLAGTVLSQTPAAGQFVPINTPINLIVANDSKCGTVLPPNSTDSTPTFVGTQPVYSNGAKTGNWPNCADYQTPRLRLSNYGDQFQCVELIKRFYALDMHIGSASGWAAGSAKNFYVNAAALGLSRFPNYGDPESMIANVPPNPIAGATKPAINDMIVFDKVGSQYGHIAIVKNVGVSTITIAEQNQSSTGGQRVLNLVAHGALWEVQPDTNSTYTPIGWLRLAPTVVSESDFASWVPFSFVTDDPGFGPPGPGTSSATIVRLVSGGNPGAFLEIDLTIYGGDTAWGGAIKTDFTYDPRVSGPIKSLAINADVVMFSPGATAWQLVIKQDNQTFYSVPFGAFSNGPWSTASMSNLLSVNFDTNPWANSGGAPTGIQPDFSANGKPIVFGFLMGNALRASGAVSTARHGLDNFVVTVNR
jgi:hypothetical protein